MGYVGTLKDSTHKESQTDKRVQQKSRKYKTQNSVAFPCFLGVGNRNPQLYTYQASSGPQNYIPALGTFLHTNNEQYGNEITEAVPTMIVSKRMKCLGINLTQGVKK